MKIMLRLARVQGAEKFINISGAHIDGCIYLGDASVAFPKMLADAGGKVSVPTTMNAISIDRKRWRRYDIDNNFAEQSNQVALEYERMGVKPTFSCTPYQLPDPPKFGEHIAWAESNAIVYANSVLGARTNRYGDFMDICAALIGRAPLSGYHLDKERLGTVLVKLPEIKKTDSLFYPVLGYLIGSRIGSGVPVIDGLNDKPISDDLKAFGAAITTTGSVGMFHMVGITPEASTVEEAFGFQPPQEVWKISSDEIEEYKRKLTLAGNEKVKMILLGSPQFSVSEFEALAGMIDGKSMNSKVRMIITTNSHGYNETERKGFIATVEEFGAEIITDSCLCMIEPFIRSEVGRPGVILTNSGKFTHYGPGLTRENDVYLTSLNDCVKSAVSGSAHISAEE